jgi:adenosylhomocysteine nucleosidase
MNTVQSRHMRLAIMTAVEAEFRAVSRVCSGRENVRVFRIGIGAKRMPDLAELRGFDGIVMAGLAGGIDPNIKTGEIVMDEATDDRLPRMAYRYGRVECCQEIISTPAAKAELFRKTGALAVEMETEVVRKVAREIGLPYMGIRAIADSAADPLDPRLLKYLDEFGQVKSIGIVKHLTQLPKLARMSRIATAALAEAVECLLKLTT